MNYKRQKIVKRNEQGEIICEGFSYKEYLLRQYGRNRARDIIGAAKFTKI